MSTFTTESTRESNTSIRVANVTQRRVISSEWIKMRSLRSTTLTLAAGVLALVITGWTICWFTNGYWSTLRPEELAAFNPVERSLVGYNLAQLAVCVLGVLLVTGEYSTGMIRATFGAVPQRLPVLWAKATVYAAVTFILTLVSAFLAFLGGQLLLNSHGTTLSADGVVRSLFGIAGYLTLIGVFAVALGFIVRSTAGGIAMLFGLLLVLPGIGLLLPGSWQQHLLPYLPSNAGASMISTHPAPGSLTASTGLVVLVLWAACALGLAALVLKRRDA